MLWPAAPPSRVSRIVVEWLAAPVVRAPAADVLVFVLVGFSGDE